MPYRQVGEPYGFTRKLKPAIIRKGMNTMRQSIKTPKTMLDNVKLINLPKVEDSRGNLSIIEENINVPFTIKRAYWIYDVPGGQKRFGHAFKTQHEFIVALSGSFDVILNDGTDEKIYPLNRSYYGIYIPNHIWRRIENFSTNSVALVLSSSQYDADDYIEDYGDYIEYLKKQERTINFQPCTE